MERKPKLTYKKFIKLSDESQALLVESTLNAAEQTEPSAKPSESMQLLLKNLTELDVKVCSCRRCVEVRFPSTFSLCVLNPPPEPSTDFLVFLVRRTLSVSNLQRIAGGCTAVCSFGSDAPTELVAPSRKTPCQFCKQRTLRFHPL